MPFEDDGPRQTNLVSPLANGAAIHVVQVPDEITTQEYTKACGGPRLVNITANQATAIPNLLAAYLSQP